MKRKFSTLFTCLFYFFVCLLLGHQQASAKILSLSCNGSTSAKLHPIKNESGIFQVGIGIVPLNITRFNLKESSADVDFYLTIEYRLPINVKDLKCVGDEAKNVWRIFYNPDIEFMNIPDPEYVQGSHWLVSQNRFIYMTRVKGSASIDGNFRNFPFDSTKISFTAAGEDNNGTLQLNPSNWYHPELDSLVNQFGSVRIPGWHLKNAKFSKKLDTASDGTGTWDLLSLELDLERKSSTVIIRSGIPLLLLYLVALISLRFPKEFLDARIGTQAAVLLALFAYSVYFIESIPATDYITFGDLTWMTILVAIFLIILSEALGHGGRSKKWEISLKSYLPLCSIFLVSALGLLGLTLFFAS